MVLNYTPKYVDCKCHTPNNEAGFKLITPKKGDTYTGYKPLHHSIVFMLNGKIEFSHNEHLHCKFVKGDMVLLPQSSMMYGVALEDSKIMILSFNNDVDSYCDNCMMSEYKRSDADMKYEFKPLRITPTIQHFCELMEEYLAMDLQCTFMHQVKQKELLILLRYSYPKFDIVQFFLPMIGESMSFRNKIHKYYQEGLSVTEYASRLNMSVTLFLEKFKQEFGSSPYQWILKQKRNHIMVRLSMPDTTISDITREFKFTDGSHFVKYCKRQFGCTPQTLIKQLKNREEIR